MIRLKGCPFDLSLHGGLLFVKVPRAWPTCVRRLMDDSVVDPASKAAAAALERSNRSNVIVGHSAGHSVCHAAAVQLLMLLVMMQLDLFRNGVDGAARHRTI